MNQIYGCLRCMKALDLIRIKMVVSVVHSMGILYIASAKIPEREGSISPPSFYG